MKSEMHSLLGWALSLALLLTGCGSGTGEASSGSPASQPEKERLIRISADDREIIFSSTAARRRSRCMISFR